MLVKDRGKAAHRGLLGAVRSGIPQGLGVAGPLRLLQLARVRHGFGPNCPVCLGAARVPFALHGSKRFSSPGDLPTASQSAWSEITTRSDSLLRGARPGRVAWKLSIPQRLAGWLKTFE